jgi:hypothetical protein
LGEQAETMSALITSVEHAFAAAGSDTVKGHVAPFMNSSAVKLVAEAIIKPYNKQQG